MVSRVQGLGFEHSKHRGRMLTGLPETSRGETRIGEKTLMTYHAKVVELFWPMQNSHYPQYNRWCV
jgi:hypothetical protein